MNHPTLEQLRRLIDFSPIPDEGGEMARVFLDEEIIERECLPPRFTEARSMGSGIYFLLTCEEDSFSAIHRLNTVEIYHFYAGDPVELFLLYGNEDVRRAVLGPNLAEGHHLQFPVPSGVWQCSRIIEGGEYGLMGATMAPGFHPEAFSLGVREELLREFPDHRQLVEDMTRGPQRRDGE